MDDDDVMYIYISVITCVYFTVILCVNSYLSGGSGVCVCVNRVTNHPPSFLDIRHCIYIYMVIMSLIAPFITFPVLLKYGCSGTFIIFLSIIVGFALYRSIAQEYVEIYPGT